MKISVLARTKYLAHKSTIPVKCIELREHCINCYAECVVLAREKKYIEKYGASIGNHVKTSECKTFGESKFRYKFGSKPVFPFRHFFYPIYVLCVFVWICLRCENGNKMQMNSFVDEKYCISWVADTPDVGNLRVKLGHSSNSCEIETVAVAEEHFLIDCHRKDNVISLMFSRRCTRLCLFCLSMAFLEVFAMKFK